MKPTLPEDREAETTSPEISEHYRAGAQDEPSARVDAAIREAARRDVKPVRPARNWQIPVSVAAMVVIGFSMALLVRESEPPPSFERSADEAKLAKSAPPQLAMKTQPKARVDTTREARPSRDRSERPDRDLPVQDQAAATRSEALQESVAPDAAVPPAAAPLERDQARTAQSENLAAGKKTDSMADADPQAKRKEEAPQQQAAAAAAPEEWLRRIDELLTQDRQADAREQLLAFHKQFPAYALPPRLQALLPDRP